MIIAKSVKKARVNAGIKQYILARQLGISQAYLSRIEKGHKKPSIEVLENLADYLNKPLPVLLWLGIELSDVPENKRELFESIKPSFDELLKSVFEL